MHHTFAHFASVSVLALLLAAQPSMAQTSQTKDAHTPSPALIADTASPTLALVDAVSIPYEKFVLPNGLTTIVHTDRKAPIVGVTLYYRIGSKHEPSDRTGFAHLYEHLFFGGSENVPDFDVPLEAVGSTPTNGSTWYDRTNYVETVPTGALDLALFMESDRMEHILGAITQDKLDKQRGVVQNEKRQGDNQPYGLMDYAVGEGLFPVGHPYRHATIGSMADLNAATLDDVRAWFHANYGPENVVLVLSGDIDMETARPKVTRWFGDIAKGPAVKAVEAGPVTLPAPISREMSDNVPVLRITRNWSGPGLNHTDAPALAMGMHVLGGLASSRLDNALVRQSQVAVSVSASAQTFENVSFLQISMDVKPGVERKKAEALLDAEVQRLLRDGPTADEVNRAVTSTLSSVIGKLELVGGFYGKGATLAEGELYSSDPAKYRKDLHDIADLTPEAIRAALNTWLSRPVFSLAVIPGKRTESGDTMGGRGDEATQVKASPPVIPAATPATPAKMQPIPTTPHRIAPPVTPVADLAFPKVEHARLANGIPVILATRSAIPKVLVSISFDAGIAADASDTPGAQSLMLAMLEEGTKTRNSIQIAEDQERLGASINTGASRDLSTISLSALRTNLAPSLTLMADIVRNPAFKPSEVDRLKEQSLAELSQIMASLQALANRTFAKALYGDHPYSQPDDGLGTEESLKRLNAQSLKATHARWIHPATAKITVVGDITMEQLLPLLNQAFGTWPVSRIALPDRGLDKTVAAATPRILLVDRPNSPQSVILAGKALPITGTTPDMEALDLANEVLGGGFLSRLNSDLREEKGWSYGVYSRISSPKSLRTFTVSAPVQADKTGESIRTITNLIDQFPAQDPINTEELERVIEGNIRRLPNRFETMGAVHSALVSNTLLDRPDDYYSTLPSKYRAQTPQSIEAAAQKWLRSDNLLYVVVGDRKVIEPQLKELGLPIELVNAPAPTEASPTP